MFQRKKIILVAGVLVLLVAIILALIFNWFSWLGEKPPEDFEAVLQREQKEQLEVLQKSEPLIPTDPQEISKSQVKQLVISFVEKFGSYSNQSNYQNLEELKTLMTPEMQVWAGSLIENGRHKDSNNEVYQSQTTRALAAQETSYDEEKGEAEFLVKCQRQEVNGNASSPRDYYQDIKVKLRKIGDEWLVDKAEWQ